MASRSRSRGTGRFESQQFFSAIPLEVMESASWRLLPHFARSVLAGIAAQYRGRNNGDLALTARMARAIGITPKQLNAANPLLIETGLIELMRQGRLDQGRGICSLFALTWKPIDPSDKYDQPRIVQTPAPNSWAKWVPPDNWADLVRAARQKSSGRKFLSPHVRTWPMPHGGSDGLPVRSAREEQGRWKSSPHVRVTSRDLGVRAQVERLIRTQPHLTDGDVANAIGLGIDSFAVAAIRQQLDGGLGRIA